MLGVSAVAFFALDLMKAIEVVPRLLLEWSKGTCSLEQVKSSKHGSHVKLADGLI